MEKAFGRLSLHRMNSQLPQYWFAWWVLRMILGRQHMAFRNPNFIAAVNTPIDARIDSLNTRLQLFIKGDMRDL